MTETIEGTGPATITVVLADDHPAIRAGLRMQLERIPGVQVLAEAQDGDEAVTAIEEHRPDVAVVDLRMPGKDGIEIAAAVGDDTRVVLLSATTDSQVVQRALEAGAAGYVDKESGLDIIEAAVREVARGRRYVDPSLVAGLLDSAGERLSEREIQVLQLAGNGMQNKTIAAQLALSEETVKSHISNIMRKLDAHSRTEAVAAALRRSLIR